MAVIGTIRRNSWILIVFLGLALAAFVLMDLFSGSSRLGVQELSLGKVNGDKIDYREFTEMENALFGGQSVNTYATKNYLWNHFLNKEVLEDESEALGLSISKEEMVDLQFGQNPADVIRQRFVNPNTGQVDYQQLQNVKRVIESGQLTDPEQRRYWYFQEKEVMNEGLERKLSNAIAKGIYTPDWQAEIISQYTYGTADLKFVKFPYSEMDIPENQVSVSDADIKNYIKENESKYIRPDETRTAEYVVFEVMPTQADTARVFNSLDEIKTRFQEADNDTSFVLANDGDLWTDYKTLDQLDPAYAEDAFSNPVGTILGPIKTQSGMEVIKIVDRKAIPDSVRSRHILLSPKTQEEVNVAFQRLDSLKTEIEEGRADFAEVARTVSQGPSASKGGDLGFAGPGQMVKQFNDLIFFSAEGDDLNIVGTEFGLHLVQVTGRKYTTNQQGVRLATVQRPFIPSEQTQDSIYRLAQELLSENRELNALKSAARERGMRIQSSKPMEENDFSFGLLGSGSESRQIVKWMFDPSTEEGAVSPTIYSFQEPQLYYTKNFVIAGLSQIQPAGLPSVEDVRFEVEPLLRNNKKGEIFVKEKIGGSVGDIEELASKFGKEVQEAKGVGFNIDIINGIGDEPEVVAAATQLERGQFSRPIIGKGGVYVIQVENKVEVPKQTNFTPVKTNNDQAMVRQTNAAMLKSLKDKAIIIDDRSKFF